jgi:hypothetical protein
MNYKYIGLVLLGLWLTVQGLERIFSFYFPHEDKILPAINFTAGLILLGYAIKWKHGDIGLFLLGCWAALRSGLFLFHYSFSYSNTILDVLGLVAGILLILRL